MSCPNLRSGLWVFQMRSRSAGAEIEDVIEPLQSRECSTNRSCSENCTCCAPSESVCSWRKVILTLAQTVFTQSSQRLWLQSPNPPSTLHHTGSKLLWSSSAEARDYQRQLTIGPPQSPGTVRSDVSRLNCLVGGLRPSADVRCFLASLRTISFIEAVLGIWLTVEA
jgi:hypothetical protein